MPQPRVELAGRARLGPILQAVVTVAALLLLLWLIDVRAAAALIASARLDWFLAGVGVALADRAFMIAKWYPLLLAQTAAVSLAHAARTYLAASFAALVLPASIGGDVLRAVAIGRGRGQIAEVAASVAAERLLGLVASGVMSLVALGIAVRAGLPLAFLLPWALASFGLSLVATVLPLSPGAQRLVERWTAHVDHRPVRFLRRFTSGYAGYRAYGRTLGIVGFLSLIEQAFPIAGYWVLARALGLEISLASLLVAVPLTLFLARLPISLGGLGVAEGAMVYLLGLFAVSPVGALALAVAGRLVELISILPGALLWRDLARSPDASAGPAAR